MPCACKCCCGCCCDGDTGSQTTAAQCVAPKEYLGNGSSCAACCDLGQIRDDIDSEEDCPGVWVADARCAGCGCPPDRVCGEACCEEGQECVDGVCVPCEGTCCVDGQPLSGYTQETCEGTWFESCEPCVCTPPTPYDDCPYEPGTCNRAFCHIAVNTGCYFEYDQEAGDYKFPPVLNCSKNNAQGAMDVATGAFRSWPDFLPPADPTSCEERLNLPQVCDPPAPGEAIQYGEPYQIFGSWAVECWRCLPENPLP